MVDQHPGHSETIEVTLSLPGLRRMRVSVPSGAWMEGEHYRITLHDHAWLDAC